MVTANQLQILAVLAEHPEREFYLSELGALIGKHPGVFQKGINALEREGWVTSTRRGNQRLFRVNAKHPLLKEMKALIRKSIGAEALLKSIVNNMPEVKTALIYGSYAKESMRADSDIDLLVVANDLKVEDSLVGELSKVEKSLQRDVNYKIYEQKDFKQRRKQKDPFLSEVLSDKHIILKGDA
ncbi:MAG: nucleotidyltransferase domain-containing protein [Candidatus Omnitrophica bacterium]|nr:nucleotidyltransferase domain-containing protein [Candidatus Omnitrophota bacterium]